MMHSTRFKILQWSRACSTLRAAPENAYKILGVRSDCNGETIRVAFRELAKATHPDMQQPKCGNGSTTTSTVHFVRVLAAYQILADPQKRAVYDAQLRAQEKIQQQRRESAQKRQQGSRQRDGFSEFSHREDQAAGREEFSDQTASTSPSPEREEFVCPDTEVVEWLKYYRHKVTTAVHRKEIGVGGGLLEHMRGEAGSALRKAYHGPPVYEENGIPACFEADERAQSCVTDILQLVSGHNLFGFVRRYRKPLLGSMHMLHPHLDDGRNLGDADDSLRRNVEHSNSDSCYKADDAQGHQCRTRSMLNVRQHTDWHEGEDGSEYADLELHVFGKVIARASRLRQQENDEFKGESTTSFRDSVFVYLTSEASDHTGDPDGGQLWSSHPGTGFLGTIYGLGETNPRKVCTVHGPDGNLTHRIVQHQTPMVKHMAWYKERGPCECRCRRAYMLPSRYWIFAPRSATHNVGGWYFEIWNKNRHNRKSQSVQNEFTNIESAKGNQRDLRLHPAMFILAAAYKTLDEEAAQRRSLYSDSKVLKLRSMVSNFYVWCKGKLNSL